MSNTLEIAARAGNILDMSVLDASIFLPPPALADYRKLYFEQISQLQPEMAASFHQTLFAREGFMSRRVLFAVACLIIFDLIDPVATKAGELSFLNTQAYRHVEKMALRPAGAFAELDRNPEAGDAGAFQRAMSALMDDRSQVENAHLAAWAPFFVVGEGGR